jgi:hypothetical protein
VLEILRLLVAIGATASWIGIFVAAIIAVFVAYIGIAMWATFHASDPEQQKVRYTVFRDLVEATIGRWRK